MDTSMILHFGIMETWVNCTSNEIDVHTYAHTHAYADACPIRVLRTLKKTRITIDRDDVISAETLKSGQRMTWEALTYQGWASVCNQSRCAPAVSSGWLQQVFRIHQSWLHGLS